uniref:GIY-YIG domain-containing protein n=1 Tax=Octopus bimaculoides TaxID=37653 RepID=A0A0L8HPF8_OCTBM
MSRNVLYKCTVNARGGPYVYIGASADIFKSRCRNHIASFRKIHKRNVTSLADFVWRPKEEKAKYNLAGQ